MKIGYSPKTEIIEPGLFLHFWYANNKGRGRDNVTIIKSRDPRAATSAKQTSVIARAKTSHWAGNVNFSKQVQDQLAV